MHKKYFFIVSINLFFFSCYSFSDSFFIKSKIKNINIPIFFNSSKFINPNLNHEFTLALENKFIEKTECILVKKNPDLSIFGNITSYEVLPIKSGDNINKNRLFISVDITCESYKLPEKSFQKKFYDFIDFEGNKSLDNPYIKFNLVKKLTERLVNEIFNNIKIKILN